MTDFGSTAGGGGCAVDGAGAPEARASGRRVTQRRWSSAEQARIVAESHEPGATVVGVAARHGIGTWSLSRWRRRAREEFLPAVTAGAAPPFVPVVVEDAASERAVTIEACGVVVRLPGDSAVDRIVAVASGLGRAW